MPKSQPLLPDPNPNYQAPQQGYGMFSYALVHLTVHLTVQYDNA